METAKHWHVWVIDEERGRRALMAAGAYASRNQANRAARNLTDDPEDRMVLQCRRGSRCKTRPLAPR